ncbi:MAG: hypothetical protein FJ218_00930 [Ignavibacteria bacterium]|nr:hypothetical protein [Ignavibacteria bacterium]
MKDEPEEHVGKQMIISKIDDLENQKKGNRSKVTYEGLVQSINPDDENSFKKLVEVFYLDPKGMGGKIDSLFDVLRGARKINRIDLLLYIFLLLLLVIIEMFPIAYSLGIPLPFPPLGFIVYASVFVLAFSAMLFPITKWIYYYRFSIVEEDNKVFLLENRER